MASTENNLSFQLMRVVDNIVEENEHNKHVAGIFKYLEEITGVNRKIIWWSLVVFTSLWLVMGYAGQFVTNFIGIIYPVYASVYAIESADTNDDRKWLTYWIIYSIFSVTECFVSYVIGWFPLYWFAKCCFLVWLMIPTDFNGALVLYHNIIQPYFLEYHSLVDNTINELQSTAADFIEKNK